jgi:uncharacterized protein
MNHLTNSKSPYLQQHKDNPVDWFPWGPEAFAKAKAENKPIFLSIGYSTCHWCHVMARESFSDADVAASLNKYYVSIKLDREERPDIDEVYMTALLALHGSGGWPLSAWLTPEAKPFFAGTYFPKPQFLALINRIGDLWQSEKQNLLGDAEKFNEILQKNFQPPPKSNIDVNVLLTQFDTDFEANYDEVYGGFKGAPKFPHSFSLIALMRSDRILGSTRAREIVHHTLTGMIDGGLFDHVEGGFHRYAVDQKWAVPHFEKMLYDQAWIAISLFEAAQFLQEPWFTSVGEKTLSFVCEELRHADGGFFSALDAESKIPGTSQKQEGYYFTFSEEDLKTVLSADELNEVKKMPTIDGRFVLQRPSFDAKKLATLRTPLPQPGRDEKIIAAWNGWMIMAYCKGFDATKDPKWLLAAQEAWRFAEKNLIRKEGVSRRWADGDTAIPGTSEDYAGLIGAALSLYHSSLEENYLVSAIRLQSGLDETFWDASNGGYFLSDNSDPHLLLKFQQDRDGVTPTTNSLSLNNLAKLKLLTSSETYDKQIESLTRILTAKVQSNPLSHGFAAVSLANQTQFKKIIVASADREFDELRKRLCSAYHPFVLLAQPSKTVEAPQSAGAETFFVCTQNRCLPGVGTAKEALETLGRA